MRLLVLLLALAGCASAPIQVKVPVFVPCAAETPAEPVYRFKPPYDDIFVAVRDLKGDFVAALAYEQELRVALESCRKP